MNDSNRYDNISSLYRSKTPTADLYSTEPKTILPIRSKTPLVDTRSHIISPSNDLQISELEASLDKKNNFKFHASLEDNRIGDNNSSSLTNQYNPLDIENNVYESKSNPKVTTKQYFNMASGGFNSLEINSENIYSITSNCYEPTIPNHYTDNEYTHENCFCYECQDYSGRKQDSNYSTLPPQMNDNVGNRLNQFMNEKRFNNIQERQNNVNNQWKRHEISQKSLTNQVSILILTVIKKSV